MKTNHNEMFVRNLGLLTKADQELLSTKSIAIAGTGGDGGLLAERLTRFGIGKLMLADPDKFEASNLNRQFGANQLTIGKNKAEVVGEELKKINPSLEIKIFNEGISQFNVRKFVEEADVIIDEIEFSLPKFSVMLHRECRRQGKYVFMGANIGWGATVTCFEPEGSTFEEQFEYNEKDESINPMKFLKEKPGYITDELLTEILDGNIPVPALSGSVGLVAGIISTEIVLFLTKKRQPITAPNSLYIDLFDLTIQKF